MCGRSQHWIFYSGKNQRTNLNQKLCCICRRPNHLTKDCFYRNDKPKTGVLNQKKEQRNFSSITRKELKQNKNSAFSATKFNNSLHDKIWILDSGASCHKAKEKIWFDKIILDQKDIHLAGNDMKILSVG